MSLLRRTLWNARLAALGRARQFLAELEGLQSASPEQVVAARDERLARLLRHAYDTVPYYREALAAAGVVDGATVSLERFTSLPLLDKDTIRSRFDDLLASDRATRGPYYNTSGGSTGEPVRFVQDRDTSDWKVAEKLLFDSWTGYRVGEPFALLWGAAREFGAPSLRARLGTFLRNELRLNSYRMSTETMDQYLRDLARFRPTLVLAYAQSMFQLAEHAERSAHVPHSPRAVMTSATTLEPHMRTTIERVFRTTVFDRYGSREVGDIACENGDGRGLIVSPLTHLVEVLGPDGQPVPDGTTGEIAVTLLVNYSMPLIRYRIGDAGTLGPPSGSCSWPRLTQIVGRVTDVFYTASGEQIYGGYFTRHFYGKSWVAQFQVVQEDYDHIVVRIVPAAELDEARVSLERSDLVASIRGFMGSACRVDVELVEAIPVGPTGKRRYTISKVGPPS